MMPNLKGTSKKLAIVTNAKIMIKSPLKPLVGKTLAPSMGKKHIAKTMIVKATRGANLKMVFLASRGVDVFFC